MNFFVFQFLPTANCLFNRHYWKESSSFLLLSSHQVLYTLVRSPWTFSRLNGPGSLSFSYDWCSKLLIIFTANFVCQVSWKVVLLRTVPHEILPGRLLKRTESALLKPRVVSAFYLAPFSQDPEQHHLRVTGASCLWYSHIWWVLLYLWESGPEGHLPLLVPWSPVTGSCYQCSPETFWIGCAVLYCLSSRCWNSKSLSWALGLGNVRIPPVLLRRLHLLLLLDQAVYRRSTTQHHHVVVPANFDL